MKKLIAGVILGVSLTALAHGAGDPAAGKENAALCESCHGPGGAKPIMGVYPVLSGIGETYMAAQMRLIKSGDRAVPEMTGMLDNFDAQDMQDLAAYFNEQSATGGQADPDLVPEGQALYRGGNMASGVPACAACHNPQGKGNEPAGYPRLSGQSADYVVKQLEAYRSGTRGGDNNAQLMTDVASRLTDAEIEAVASYVDGLY